MSSSFRIWCGHSSDNVFFRSSPKNVSAKISLKMFARISSRWPSEINPRNLLRSSPKIHPKLPRGHEFIHLYEDLSRDFSQIYFENSCKTSYKEFSINYSNKVSKHSTKTSFEDSFFFFFLRTPPEIRPKNTPQISTTNTEEIYLRNSSGMFTRIPASSEIHPRIFPQKYPQKLFRGFQ